jgi:hypothetical protein
MRENCSIISLKMRESLGKLSPKMR